MQYVILGGLLLAIMVGVVQIVANASPRLLALIGRFVIGFGLIAVGIGLMLARQFAFALPAIFLGFAALVRGRIGGFSLGGSSPGAGQASSVKARFIEATLDHDTGELTGQVVEGSSAGRGLDELTEPELDALRREASIDPDSVALVEAYLDRRFPGWREDGEEDAGPGPGRAADSGAMTDEEAYEILGLPTGAGEAEIRAAHRRLLKGVHPDQGGSTFLAARINEAKDRLLGRHRRNSQNS